MAKERFEIRNEDDLFRAIRLIQEGEFPKNNIPFLIEWPAFDLTISGKQFDGGMPSRVISDILTLQQIVNKIYSYGINKDFVYRLPERELREAELTVRIEKGSGKFWADLYPIFNAAFSKLEDHNLVLALLATVAIIGTVRIWDIYFDYKKHDRTLETEVELGEQRTERLRIIKEVIDGNAYMEEIVQSLLRTIEGFSRRLEDEDSIWTGKNKIMNGYEARRLSERRDHSGARHVIESMFLILSVSSGSRVNGFSILVRNTNDNKQYRITMEETHPLYHRQRFIRRSEWGKTPIWMMIEVIEHKPRVSTADLIALRRKKPKRR